MFVALQELFFLVFAIYLSSWKIDHIVMPIISRKTRSSNYLVHILKHSTKCFQGLEKGCIENKYVKTRICQHFELGASYLGKNRWNTKCRSGSIFIAIIQVSDFMHWTKVVESNSKAIDARKISILVVNRLT